MELPERCQKSGAGRQPATGADANQRINEHSGGLHHQG